MTIASDTGIDNTEKAITFTMTDTKETKRTHMFTEEIGEVAWSEEDVAVGNLYIKTSALRMIGSPKKIKVTIEPAA